MLQEEARLAEARKAETQRLMQEAAARDRDREAAEKAQLQQNKEEEARLVSAMTSECERLLECLKTPGKPIEGPRHRVLPVGNEASRLANRILGHEATYVELEAVQWALGKSRKKKRLAPSDIYADLNPPDTPLPASAPGSPDYEPCPVCHR